MPDTITLSGNYGYEAYKVTGIASTTIDASDAAWTVANIGDEVNLYPFSVRDSSDVTMQGGTINGEVSLELDWEDAYVNSAAVYSRNVDDVVIRDWTIDRAWDAIRVRSESDGTFEIDRVHLTNIRDDGVENDDGLSGTISNSLFDGVFVGVSLADGGTGDRTDNVVTLDNVMIRMESFEYKGEETHQSIFKTVEGVSPKLSLHDCVFAIEDVDHAGQGRLQIAWDNVVSSSDNVFLNLSDDPLPDDYPMPPEGFTVLQGQEARDYWETARAEFVDEVWGDGDADAEVDAPDAEGEPDPSDDQPDAPPSGEPETEVEEPDAEEPVAELPETEPEVEEPEAEEPETQEPVAEVPAPEPDAGPEVDEPVAESPEPESDETEAGDPPSGEPEAEETPPTEEVEPAPEEPVLEATPPAEEETGVDEPEAPEAHEPSGRARGFFKRLLDRLAELFRGRGHSDEAGEAEDEDEDAPDEPQEATASILTFPTKCVDEDAPLDLDEIEDEDDDGPEQTWLSA